MPSAKMCDYFAAGYTGVDNLLQNESIFLWVGLKHTKSSGFFYASRTIPFLQSFHIPLCSINIATFH
jgi:hypothetical protein